MNRIIMHIDMDAFFAAIEQRDNQSFQGKPVIVGALPGNRGVVSTCSYEARVYGIRSAMPISEAYKRCPQGIYLKPNFDKYVTASRHVKAILSEYSPCVEPVSIDEAFIDLTGCERLFGGPEHVAHKIRDRIRNELNLTASIGIGPNRLIAKIASDFQKPDGLTIVPPEKVLEFLAPLPVERLWGVGKKTLETLHRMNIRTIRDLQCFSLSDLQIKLGLSIGESLHRYAHGIASDHVGLREPRKTISKETTFEKDRFDSETLKTTLQEQACEVGRTARMLDVIGHTVTLKLRLEGFETHTIRKTLESPTDEDHVIFQTAWELYQAGKYFSKPVRLIGCGLASLREKREGQMNLFDATGKNIKGKELYHALDKIRDRFGEDSIGPATVVTSGKQRK